MTTLWKIRHPRTEDDLDAFFTNPIAMIYDTIPASLYTPFGAALTPRPSYLRHCLHHGCFVTMTPNAYRRKTTPILAKPGTQQLPSCRRQVGRRMNGMYGKACFIVTSPTPHCKGICCWIWKFASHFAMKCYTCNARTKNN